MTGRFIVIEGPDGAGTTTHAALLAKHFRGQGIAVAETAEPSSGPIGLWIRKLLSGGTSLSSSALQTLFTADRAWHDEAVIRPALARGETVVCDRYDLSTLAYGVAGGVQKDWLQAMNAYVSRPTRTVLLLPPLEVCLQRLAKRGEKEYFDDAAFQQKIHDAYRTLAQELSIPVIDSADTKEAVAAKILALVS